MNYFVFLSLLVCFNTPASGHYYYQNFDKVAYYAAIAAENMQAINNQLNEVKNLSAVERDAFEGAMLMKKAGMKNSAKEKLALFKSGKKKLESAIEKANDNIEYRLLRLIIQEHAPGIVKYRNDIEKDCRLINNNYKTLPASLQHRILDYNKNSKCLKIS